MKRIRILYVILAVLLLASVGPLLFYALKTLDINRRALETNEVLLQNTITRSVAEEISIYNSSFHQLLDNLNHLLMQQPGLSRAGQGFQTEELRKTLEGMISSSRHIIHITVLDAQGRGIQAGNYSADSDPFLVRMLDRAFAAAQQRSEFQSDPVLISQSQDLFPAMLIARPIIRSDSFQGMMAVVLNLQSLVERLKSSSVNGLEAFVVDRGGNLVLTSNLQSHSLGQSMTDSSVGKGT
jgi:hypothetical protein